MFDELLARLGRRGVECINRWIIRHPLETVQAEAVSVLAYCAEHGAGQINEAWSMDQFMFWMSLSPADVFVYEYVLDRHLQEAPLV
jgi:hypothetical protein